MATRLLSPADIYDLYGCEWVTQAPHIDAEDQQLLDFRLNEIRDIYVAAAKTRIRAEASYLGLDVDAEISFEGLIARIKDAIGKKISATFESQACNMMGGGSFNLMGAIMQAHRDAGHEFKGINMAAVGLREQAPQEKQKPPEVDVSWFTADPAHKSKHGRITDDPRWAEIARAYLAMEQAASNNEIISAVDRMNDLAHNSFHVLIDLQTGRMLNDFENASSDRDARKRLQEVLDIRKHARHPTEFMAEMSKDVRKLMNKYRSVLPKPQ